MDRPLGVCTWTYGPRPLTEIAGSLAQLGFDGVELHGDLEAFRPDEVRALLADHGLRAFSLTPANVDVAHPDAKDPHGRHRLLSSPGRLRRRARWAAGVGARAGRADRGGDDDGRGVGPSRDVGAGDRGARAGRGRGSRVRSAQSVRVAPDQHRARGPEADRRRGRTESARPARRLSHEHRGAPAGGRHPRRRQEAGLVPRRGLRTAKGSAGAIPTSPP